MCGSLRSVAVDAKVLDLRVLVRTQTETYGAMVLTSIEDKFGPSQWPN